MGDKAERRTNTYQKTLDCAAAYINMLVFSMENVSTFILNQIKKLAGDKIEIVMGKGTTIRKALRSLDTHQGIDRLCKGNVGVAFTNLPLSEAKAIIEEPRVKSAAKVGQLSQADYVLPKGPTGLEVANTNYFQALDIPTKIVSSQIEIVSDFLIIKTGKVVKKAETNLLNLFGIEPFTYMAHVQHVGKEMKSAEREIFGGKYLDVTSADIKESIKDALTDVKSFSLASGIVNELTIRTYVAEAIREVIQFSAGTSEPVEEAKKAIEAGANCASVVVEKAEEKVEEEEKEVSEDEDFDDLFD
eukprot:GAHX01000201.1.p1 GENE.GAHX01000201.1~~GAHX01000201.1.p1  ORF type:complete len:302 (-),score=80.36 GAHX01000201.1:85-990(-)